MTLTEFVESNGQSHRGASRFVACLSRRLGNRRMPSRRRMTVATERGCIPIFTVRRVTPATRTTGIAVQAAPCKSVNSKPNGRQS